MSLHDIYHQKLRAIRRCDRGELLDLSPVTVFVCTELKREVEVAWY